jgi:adenine specific DNA methylase Mod
MSFNFAHSTWLTFMKNRLEVARDLLSEDGVIFVQCDDNEQAYLKVFNQAVFIAVKIYLIANTILGVFFSTGDDFFI